MAALSRGGASFCAARRSSVFDAISGRQLSPTAITPAARGRPSGDQGRSRFSGGPALRPRPILSAGWVTARAAGASRPRRGEAPAITRRREPRCRVLHLVRYRPQPGPADGDAVPLIACVVRARIPTRRRRSSLRRSRGARVSPPRRVSGECLPPRSFGAATRLARHEDDGGADRGNCDRGAGRAQDQPRRAIQAQIRCRAAWRCTSIPKKATSRRPRARA